MFFDGSVRSTRRITFSARPSASTRPAASTAGLWARSSNSVGSTEIGAHTRDHTDLTLLSENDAREEMESSVHEIRRRLGKIPSLFAYPGGASMPLHQSLTKYADRLRTILPRHEQGGAFAAQGYARSTGRPGVVMATSGPGATNLVTAIADAKREQHW